jgi:hypothetical protein
MEKNTNTYPSNGNNSRPVAPSPFPGEAATSGPPVRIVASPTPRVLVGVGSAPPAASPEQQESVPQAPSVVPPSTVDVSVRFGTILKVLALGAALFAVGVFWKQSENGRYVVQVPARPNDGNFMFQTTVLDTRTGQVVTYLLGTGGSDKEGGKTVLLTFRFPSGLVERTTVNPGNATRLPAAPAQ